uniref:Uncharacterized protein n=1 Tax=Physcomitrium patens TaxID=3218 RepID=A0A2K1K632_PHYPA|nr:hypothetical protein PHYPA_011131 [Physcomitrium patens]
MKLSQLRRHRRCDGIFYMRVSALGRRPRRIPSLSRSPFLHVVLESIGFCHPRSVRLATICTFLRPVYSVASMRLVGDSAGVI